MTTMRTRNNRIAPASRSMSEEWGRTPCDTIHGIATLPSRNETTMSSTIPITETVRWYTREGGWKFGTVVKAGHKWARVTCPSAPYGTAQVLIEDLRPWPPVRDENAPAGRPVKRGAA